MDEVGLDGQIGERRIVDIEAECVLCAVVLEHHLPRSFPNAMEQHIWRARVAEVVPFDTLSHLTKLHLASFDLLEIATRDFILLVPVDYEPGEANELVRGSVLGLILENLVGELDLGDLSEIDTEVMGGEAVLFQVKADVQPQLWFSQHVPHSPLSQHLLCRARYFNRQRCILVVLFLLSFMFDQKAWLILFIYIL